MRFRGVVFSDGGAQATTIDRRFDVEWDSALIEVFPSMEAASKEAQRLWAAALYQPNARRGKAGLIALTAAVLDCDCADVGYLDATVEWLERHNVAAFVYTSWSHHDVSKAHKDTQSIGPFDCFRVVLPYSQPVTPEAHTSLVPALFGHELPLPMPHWKDEVAGRFVPAGRTVRAAKARGWDPVACVPAQAYFAPSDRPGARSIVLKGQAVDVTETLARPTAQALTFTRARPFTQPSLEATGLLGRVLQSLVRKGVYVSPSTLDGWHRAACPSCAPTGTQKSPSFVVRANADGLDLRCYAGCSRQELTVALDLQGDAAKEPSPLRQHLRDQLDENLSPRPAITVDAAAEQLVVDIRDALTWRTPTVLKYPAGTGKSYASARVIAERVRAGYRVVYSTQEHAVAHETRQLLPPDVKEQSVHLHSALVSVAGSPVCARAAEVKPLVFEFGKSLLGAICPACPLRASCEALRLARERQAQARHASVFFVSHAGLPQIVSETKGEDLELIVDEMPGVFREHLLTRPALAQLTALPDVHGVDPIAVRVVRALARAWLAGRDPEPVRWDAASPPLGEAYAMAQDFGRLPVSEGLQTADRSLYRDADAVLRVAAQPRPEAAVGSTVDGLRVFLAEPAHEALVSRGGLLLSATPFVEALPRFRVVDVEVRDGARVTRRMYLSGARGSGILNSTPRPWGLVDAALDRARREAQRYANRRILFVTFKSLADELRPRALPDVELAHFGALRGKNDWMEGALRECSVAYLFGTPRFAMLPTLQRLGVSDVDLSAVWAKYAAAELTQAEGRLRLPRRKTPCSVLVEGDVAPSSWHRNNVDEIVEIE